MTSAKTTAGIVLATGGTTAVSYAVSSQLSGETKTSEETSSENSLQQPQQQPEPKTIKAKILEVKFDLLNLEATKTGSTNKDYEELLKVAKREKITVENDDEKVTQLKDRCNELLVKIYDNSTKGNDFTEAIRKCTKPILKKERAKRLGMTPLDTEAGNSNKHKQEIERKMVDHKGLLESYVKDLSTFTISCSSEGDLGSVNGNTQNDWIKYLKVCVKEDQRYNELINKSFWNLESI